VVWGLLGGCVIVTRQAELRGGAVRCRVLLAGLVLGWRVGCEAECGQLPAAAAELGAEGVEGVLELMVGVDLDIAVIRGSKPDPAHRPERPLPQGQIKLDLVGVNIKSGDLGTGSSTVRAGIPRR
jgi:hypothetical protein